MVLKDHEHHLVGGQNWISDYLSDKGAENMGLPGVSDRVKWRKVSLCTDPDCDAMKVSPDFGGVPKDRWQGVSGDIRSTVADFSKLK